jgi:hypothetical protein
LAVWLARVVEEARVVALSALPDLVLWMLAGLGLHDIDVLQVLGY